MSVCVLGASGFIGRNLVREYGDRCVGVSRSELDLLDDAAVNAYFETHTFDTVILSAAVGGSRLRAEDWTVYRDNVRMFVNVCRHAHLFKRFVWFSSGAALQGTLSPYGQSKWTCERLASLIPNCQTFRIYNVFAPDELPTRFVSTCLRAAREGETVTIAQDRLFDFFHTRDLFLLVEALADAGQCTVDCTYQDCYTLSQVAHNLGAAYTIESDEMGSPYTGVRPSLHAFLQMTGALTF